MFFASRVDVSTEGLVARRYVGRTTRIAWEDVTSIAVLSRFAFDYREMVRISGRNWSGAFIYTDAVSDYAALSEMITRNAPMAPLVAMPLIWRLIFI